MFFVSITFQRHYSSISSVIDILTWLFSSCFPLKRHSSSSAGWRANRTPPGRLRYRHCCHGTATPIRHFGPRLSWVGASLLFVIADVTRRSHWCWWACVVSGSFFTFTTLQDSYWPPSTDILQCFSVYFQNVLPRSKLVQSQWCQASLTVIFPEVRNRKETESLPSNCAMCDACSTGDWKNIKEFMPACVK